VTDYTSLQFALYMTCFVCVIGGGFFLATAVYVEDDRKAASLATQGIKVVDCYLLIMTGITLMSIDNAMLITLSLTIQSRPVKRPGSNGRCCICAWQMLRFHSLDGSTALYC